MLSPARPPILGKIAERIAAPLDRALVERRLTGSTGRVAVTRIAAGEGWSVSDFLCTSGPSDRSFEEQHDGVSVSVVVAGTFQYRSPRGLAMLTPGSILLGNHGECYECGHEHGAGDRCIAFHFTPAFFQRIVADADIRPDRGRFRAPSIPPVRELSRHVVRAAAGAVRATDPAWSELAIDIAAAALGAGAESKRAERAPSRAAARRISDDVRRIARDPAAPASLESLASAAGQSPYQYLRAFRRITGVTPHQFVLRARLRQAAEELAATDAKVIDVALTSGFGDLSNFNHAFHAEFGATPRAYRALMCR